MGPEQINIIQMVLHAGLVVQFVLLLLLVFSVASWGIIFIKIRYLRNALRESESFKESFWKNRDLSDAYIQAKKLKASPIARVFRVGYLELKRSSQIGPEGPAAREDAGAKQAPARISASALESVQRALKRSANTETSRMIQMVPFLATTGNTTPFIGLFGTVWGIMDSFHGIGQMGSASLAVVAPGISEALIATAAGLAVAIPAVIFFNYFMYRIRLIESEMESFTADFLNIIEHDILRQEGA